DEGNSPEASHGRMRLFELVTGKLLYESHAHSGPVFSFSFSADGNLLASAGADKTVRLWRLPACEPVWPPLKHRLPVHRVILTDDGRRLIAGCVGENETEVWAWNVTTGEPTSAPMVGHFDSITMGVEPSPGERFFAHVGGNRIQFREFQ